jgi:hypothetical protein
MDLHLLYPLYLLGRTHHHSHRTSANINHLGQDLHLRRYIRINNPLTIHLGHHLLTGHPTLEVLETPTRTTTSLMDRVTKGVGMSVAMDRHRGEDEGDPNRVAGGEEAVDEIGIEEGIGTGTEEIDREILVGRRGVGGAVVLGGVNALGHKKFPEPQLRL